MAGLFFNGDFIEGFLRAGYGNVDEVLFLLFHPWLGGELRWHPRVAAEKEDGRPLEAFGFMDGGEGETWWGGWIVIGEDFFNFVVELFDRCDEGESKDGVDCGDLVGKEVELVGG